MSEKKTDKVREVQRLIKKAIKDIPWFCSKNLKIKLKEASATTGETIGPMRLNEAQMYLHDRAELQLLKTGMVRIIILKGRQQGISTYVEARFFNKVSFNRGRRAVIISHLSDSAEEIFDMVLRFLDYCNPLLLPKVTARSLSKVRFGRLDSQIQCLTAGSPEVGRSKTIHLFHGSEVAFWENASAILAGAMQAVPDAPGSEVMLESTANGVGNEFHHACMEALSGNSPFELVFIEWFVQKEYQSPVDDDFEVSWEVPQDYEGEMSEGEYQQAYNLTDEQMMWRRKKIQSLGADGYWKFKQEYPATVAEAFQASGSGSLIRVRDIVRCRKASVQASGPLIFGIDPSRGGSDTDKLIRRRGPVLFDLQPVKGNGAVEKANFIYRCAVREKPDAIFIDEGGSGGEIVNILHTMPGMLRVVHAVHFGGAPIVEPHKYKNRRAEMWGLMRDMIHSSNAKIPDDDELQADLTCPKFTYVLVGGLEVLQLESKDALRKRLGRSPDAGDAAALTFAQPIASLSGNQNSGTIVDDLNPYGEDNNRATSDQLIDTRDMSDSAFDEAYSALVDEVDIYD